MALIPYQVDLVVSDIDQAEAFYSQLLGMPGQRISPSRSQDFILSSSQGFPCVSDLSGTGQFSAGWGEKQLRGLLKHFGSLAFFVQQIATAAPTPAPITPIAKPSGTSVLSTPEAKVTITGPVKPTARLSRHHF